MRKPGLLTLALAGTVTWLTIIPLPLSASNSDDEAPIRVGLALSGGGARGIAHIGALKAIAEKEIPVHFVSGTSMGAVIGALHAGGYDHEQLRKIVDEVDWGAMFGGRAERKLTPIIRRLREQPSVVSIGYSFWKIELPPSAISDYWINRLLIEHLTEPNFRAGRDFANLPIPFRCVATDLRDGSRVVFRDGDLAKAVRASMSIPGVFPPIQHGERILVDGGLVENLPVRTVKEMGADFVIAIDISSPLKRPGEFRNLFGVISQMTDVLMVERNEEFREIADIVVRPDLGDHSFSDYSDFQRLIDAGYEATKAAIVTMPKLDQIAVRQVSSAPTHDLMLQRVHGVEIRGNESVQTDLIERELQLETGTAWDLSQALLGMDRIFASGLVDGVHLDLDDTDDGVVIRLDVTEAPKHAFDLGLSYSDEDKAGASVTFNNRNLFGFGEQARIDFLANDRTQTMGVALWGQRFTGFPFAYDLRAHVSEDQPRYFEDSQFINRAEFDRRGLNFDALIPIRRSTLARVGLEIERVASKQRPGLPFPETLSTQTVAEIGFLSDTIDIPHSPRAGRRIAFTLERNLREDEGLARYWRSELTVELATPLGERQSLGVTAFAGLSESPLPLYELFRVGGPTDIPGLNRDELWGAQAIWLSAAHRFFLTNSLSLNTRVGAGGVFRDRAEIALSGIGVGVGFGIQYDTRVGPISLDFGAHESGNTRIYLGAGFPLLRR